MIKAQIMRILRFFNRNFLRVNKNVLLDKKVIYSFDSIFEGKNKIDKNTSIYNSKIGFATYIGQKCLFVNTQIGKYCCIANNVKVIIGKHPTSKFVSIHPAFFSTRRQAGFTYVDKQKFEEIEYIDKEKKISVIIGNDVWIGENVTILGGVTIGDGAIIGANTLVTKNIEPYSINVGMPSKVLRYRFNKEDIDFLEDIKWWDKSEEWIINHKDEFEDIKNVKGMI